MYHYLLKVNIFKEPISYVENPIAPFTFFQLPDDMPNGEDVFWFIFCSVNLDFPLPDFHITEYSSKRFF